MAIHVHDVATVHRCCGCCSSCSCLYGLRRGRVNLTRGWLRLLGRRGANRHSRQWLRRQHATACETTRPCWSCRARCDRIRRSSHCSSSSSSGGGGGGGVRRARHTSTVQWSRSLCTGDHLGSRRCCSLPLALFAAAAARFDGGAWAGRLAAAAASMPTYEDGGFGVLVPRRTGSKCTRRE